MSDLEPVFTYDVFISYAKEDSAWVEGYLLDSLDEGGINYHDEEALRLGVPRLVEFERAIKESKRILLILSLAYLSEHFGQFVDVLAQSYGLETDTWPVIPLILKPVTLPPRISMLSQLDATDPNEWEYVIARLFGELNAPVPVAPEIPDSPYPGMVPFKEEDSKRFFGREREIEEVIEQLRTEKFVAVIGPSGSGKSSLVFAGVLPKLRKSRRFGKGSWTVKTMRPGGRPRTTLSQTLGLDLSTSSSGKKGTRTLLVIDQFEETFTLSDSEDEGFFNDILQLIETPDIYIILTVRADFYAEMMSSPLWEMVKKHRLEVPPMDAKDLRQAIIRPAENAGIYIEAALVEKLLADAAGEPGILPLVQETLVRLWDRVERRFLPFRAYEALVTRRGGFEGEDVAGLQVAVARQAEETISNLEAGSIDIARRTFLRLIQFGEGRSDTRRQQSVEKLKSTGDDRRQFENTLQALTENRLLTLTSDIDGNRRVDISHAALITGWPRLQKWIDERRDSEQTKRRLENKAAEWARLGKSSGGLLDEVEYQEAKRWLESDDTADTGYSKELSELTTASLDAIEIARAEKENPQRRELEQAQALAKEQEKRAEEQALAAQRLRGRASWLTGLVMVSFLLMAVAGWFGIFANEQRQLAETKELRANANSTQAVALQLTAETASTLAIAQELIAIEELNLADEARAEAETQREEADNQRFDADLQAQIARSRELAARAQTALLENQLPSSLLLAVEAINITQKIGQPNTSAAEQALRDTLGIIGGTPLIGHKGIILAANISRNGRWLGTTSADGTAKLWDLRSENPASGVITLNGHEDQVFDIKFSRDGKWAATSGLDAQVILWNLESDDPTENPFSLGGLDAPVFKVSFDPASRWVITGGFDGVSRLWDLDLIFGSVSPEAASQAPIQLPGHEGIVWDVGFSPDGRWAASAGDGGNVLLWDLQRNNPAAEPIILSGHAATILTIKFSADEQWLASADNDGEIRLWRMDTSNPAFNSIVLTGHLGRVFGLGFTPDSMRLISGGADSTVRIWDLSESNPVGTVTTLTAHRSEVMSVDVSHDNQFILTGSKDYTARLWDLNSPEINESSISLRGHDSDIQVVLFNPDATKIITASADGTARDWDTKYLDFGSSPIVLSEHRAAVSSIASSSDGRWLVSGDESGAVFLWDTHNPDIIPRALNNHQGAIHSVAFNHDNSYLATGGDDNLIQLLDIGPLQSPVITLSGQFGNITALTFSPDGQWLASGGSDKNVFLWDLTSNPPGQSQFILNGNDYTVNTLEFSPNGRWLASAGSERNNLAGDPVVRVWDLSTASAGEIPEPALLKGHVGAVTSLGFSPDNNLLVSGGKDNNAILWNMRAENISEGFITLNAHTQWVQAVQVSPDNKWVITAGADGVMHAWDIASILQNSGDIITNPTFAFRGHEDRITDIAISADSHWLVSVSLDRTARLWDMSNADPGGTAVVLRGHRDALFNTLITADGKYAITTGADNTVRLWSLNLGELISQACLVTGRNLSEGEWSLNIGGVYDPTCGK